MYYTKMFSLAITVDLLLLLVSGVANAQSLKIRTAFAFGVECDRFFLGQPAQAFGNICGPREDNSVPWKIDVGPTQTLLTFNQVGGKSSGLVFASQGGAASYSEVLPAVTLTLGDMRRELGANTITYSGRLYRSGDQLAFTVSVRQVYTEWNNKGYEAGKTLNIDTTDHHAFAIEVSASSCTLARYARRSLRPDGSESDLSFRNYRNLACKVVGINSAVKEVFPMFGIMK